MINIYSLFITKEKIFALSKKAKTFIWTVFYDSLSKCEHASSQLQTKSAMIMIFFQRQIPYR